MENKRIKIEVVYASPERQRVMTRELEDGCTIEEAIHTSGILDEFPEIDLAVQKVGVFGKLRDLSEQVKAGDRIEIYRPLLIDPKDARRAKAKRAKIKK